MLIEMNRTDLQTSNSENIISESNPQNSTESLEQLTENYQYQLDYGRFYSNFAAVITGAILIPAIYMGIESLLPGQNNWVIPILGGIGFSTIIPILQSEYEGSLKEKIKIRRRVENGLSHTIWRDEL
jgi:hypothetical protein